jgi:hypothetical protein
VLRPMYLSCSNGGSPWFVSGNLFRSPLNSLAFCPSKILPKYRIHPRILLNKKRFPDGNIMGRPKGSRNKRTLLREAEEALGRTRDPNEIVDMLLVIEKAASHFYLRAEMGKHSGTRKPKEIDEDYREAAALASLAAPYRHARLSAMKLAGDPNNPVRIKEDASLEELRELVKLHYNRLAPVLELEAIGAPADGIASRDVRQAGASNGTAADRSR